MRQLLCKCGGAVWRARCGGAGAEAERCSTVEMYNDAVSVTSAPHVAGGGGGEGKELFVSGGERFMR